MSVLYTKKRERKTAPSRRMNAYTEKIGLEWNAQTETNGGEVRGV